MRYKSFILILMLITLCSIFILCGNDVGLIYHNDYYILKEAEKNKPGKPLVVENNIIFTEKNKLICVNNENKEIKWTQTLKHNILANPVTDGLFVYAVSPYELVSIDITDGKEVWRKESTREFISEAYLYKSNLYILGEERFYSIASKLEKPKNPDIESVGQVHINQILDFEAPIHKDIGVVINYKDDMAFLVVADTKSLKYNKLIAVKLTNYNLSKLWKYQAEEDIISLMTYETINDRKNLYFISKGNILNCIDVNKGELSYSVEF
ncbi:MAG: PQQ-binding-like beta-propeller repeat protein [Spirochaetota bacterium]